MAFFGLNYLYFGHFERHHCEQIVAPLWCHSWEGYFVSTNADSESPRTEAKFLQRCGKPLVRCISIFHTTLAVSADIGVPDNCVSAMLERSSQEPL